MISVFVFAIGSVCGQSVGLEFPVPSKSPVNIVNHFGRVTVEAKSRAAGEESESASAPIVSVTATSDKGVTDSDIVVSRKDQRLSIIVQPKDIRKRIDVLIELPERSSIEVETTDGAVMVSGDLALARAKTETGTIAIDMPPDKLTYDLLWTESRPRYLSDFELEKIKEKSRGRFVIQGNTKSDDTEAANTTAAVPAGTGDADNVPVFGKKKKSKKNSTPDGNTVELETARGIILINVPPNEVSSDLRERPLTNAAKAIVRSGDSLLMDAIRRASPKYFGDYASTLPPTKREPALKQGRDRDLLPEAATKRVLVSAVDARNRAISDLTADEFEITENNERCEIIRVQPVTTPFNLVLVLDVSGSVENYLGFIRKAARSFISTVAAGDRIAIVTFNEDTKVLSGFTTNKANLSASLDTFDAGGATAYYDALAFTLTDTLRSMRGERTAIVVLTDGDDNRSFLSFDSLLGSIQESGALIYPLYVPSTLVAAASQGDTNSTVDPLRTRYMGLTTKAEGEGAKLAEVSGGAYYPITQLSQIQLAYNDIVTQLRTAYTVTFRSSKSVTGGHSPRLKVKVNRENALVKIGSVVAVKNE